MILPGKGTYTWGLKYLCANPKAPTTGEIVSVIMDGGFSHVLVKIADGVGDYNVSVDLPEIVAELQKRGVAVFGWHYIYGDDPSREADKAVSRMRFSGVTGYIIDAEVEYKNRPDRARAFVRRLQDEMAYHAIESTPVGLATYRYPSLHQDFPFSEFLAGCSFVMPQVYWQDAHNPVAQLNKSWGEYHQLAPDLPFIPTGAAYGEGDWQVQHDEIDQFLGQAQHLGFEGANFWELGYARKNLPAVYQQIKAYQWDVVTPEPPDPEPEPGEPGMTDLTPLVDAINGLTIRVGDLIDSVDILASTIGAGTEPPGQPPTVNWKRIQVTRDNQANAYFAESWRNTNDPDDPTQIPIMAIYPSNDKADLPFRIQFDHGMVLKAYAEQQRADGGAHFWVLAPEHIPEGKPQLYMHPNHVVEI